MPSRLRVLITARAELRGGQRDLLVDALRRAERAEQRRDSGPGVLAYGVLSDPPADLFIPRHLDRGLEQRHGVGIVDPVVDLLEMLGTVGHAGVLDHATHPRFAEHRAHPLQQRARERACDARSTVLVHVVPSDDAGSG
jgi:hypothetical protein